MKTRPISKIIFLHLLAIFFVIINLTTLSIGNFSQISPLLDVIIVFYFGFFRRVYSMWFLFFLGIWHDAILGNFLGVSSLTYIVLVKFFTVINSRLLIKESFTQIWYQFIAFCGIFLLMKWLILSLLNAEFYSIFLPLIHLVTTSLIYVVMHRFFNYITIKLLEDVT